MKRAMSVAGSFYPKESQEVLRYFKHFDSLYKTTHTEPLKSSRCIIVPHAGYIYSGYTANIAYKALERSLESIVVIGPSHRVGFRGVSLCECSAYETPFGEIEADTSFQKELQEHFGLPFYPQAHHEHSTEVQFPFLKHYHKKTKLIELVYSDANPKQLASIIEYVLNKESCGVVISTDLSHFYTQEKATKLDSVCIEAIESLDVAQLHSGCEACGKIGVEATLLYAKKNKLHPKVLDYRTSADATGDTSRVVGYVSVAF